MIVKNAWKKLLIIYNAEALSPARHGSQFLKNYMTI